MLDSHTQGQVGRKTGSDEAEEVGLLELLTLALVACLSKVKIKGREI